MNSNHSAISHYFIIMVIAIPMIYYSYNPSSKLFSFKTMFQNPSNPKI